MGMTEELELLVTVLCGAAVLVGVLGAAVQVLPGPAIIAAAVLVWALVERSATGWVALVLVLVLLGAGAVGKYVLAERLLSRASIPRRSITLALLAGVVGFFVIPVVGLFLFFVAGLYLAELSRLGSAAAALPSTRTALGAVGLVVLVELTSSLLAAAVWLAAVLGPPLVAGAGR